MGPRKARTDGVPLQSYRRDALSASYRRLRTAQAADTHAASRARRDRARQVAAELVATHGPQLVVEDTSIATWAVAGGKGGVQRASTRTTALSQHCPCGARVDKSLAERIHRCDACGLRGDRDAVAAVLASFTVFVEQGTPRSAPVDYDASADALGEIRRAPRSPYEGWQDTLSESTDRRHSMDVRTGHLLAVCYPRSMAGPIALASAMSRLARVKCPWCRHEKLVDKKPVGFRKCPRCHKQYPDPLTRKRK